MVEKMSDFVIKEKTLLDNTPQYVEDEICYQKMYKGICKLQEQYNMVSPIEAGSALQRLLKSMEKYGV